MHTFGPLLIHHMLLISAPPKSIPAMGGGGGGAGKFNTVAVKNSGGVHGSISGFGKGSVDDCK